MKYISLRRSKFLVVISFLFSIVSSFAQNSGKIRGEITASDGKPVSGVLIVLKNSDYKIITNNNGNFKFNKVVENIYVIQASLDGYETIEQQITVVNNETATVNLQFKTSNQPQSKSTNAASDGSGAQLDEIIVSASRKVETLSKTPSSVTVINSKDIEDLSIVSPNIANILAYAVPGLGSATNNTGNYGQTLRGRNPLVLIDGIPQSTPLKSAGREMRSIDPSVIERIEVIKGATAIYGNGADGGLINYITKSGKTQKKFAGYSEAGTTGNVKGDSTAGYRFNQQFYGKINKFNYIVGGTYEKTGVFRDGEGEVISPEYGLGETKTYNIFTKVGYDLTDKQRIELMYNYFSSNQDSDYILKNGVYGVTPAIGILGNRPGVDEGTKYNHNANLQYVNKQFFGNTSLTANLYFQDFLTIFSNSAFFYGGGQSQTASTKKGFRVYLNSPFTISSNFSGDVIYGFDLLNDKTNQKLVDGRVWVPNINMVNLAPYAQVSTRIFGDWNVKAGLRAENIKINIDDYNTIATGTNGGGSIAVKGGDLSYDAFVFNTGIRYSRFKFFNPFVSFSQSFSIFDLGRVLTAAKEDAISKLQTKPIIVNNYEGGFSSQLGKFNLSAAYYFSTSKLGTNMIQVDGFSVAERLPERVWGYEVQADYQILKQLTVGGNYAYVQGRGDKDSDGNFYGPNDIYLKSNRIPPVKMTAYAKFGNKRLNVELYWMYVGDRDLFQPNAKGAYAIGEGPIHSFDLWNLATAYKVTERIRVKLGIENIFNTDYYPTTSQFYGTNANYTRGNGTRFNLALGYSF
ncbi:TonB-dependent receptor [Flavobacterium hibernum]|uniref:Ferric aerobactin receptor n=1 Tax=Flavobacterium hibernum TaxID=37752 RepID=A0A0D0EDK5_9FLAO|nr:TonB-dependent receptor [Flavobacterium hibernum]KIO50764.1 ferric aerobactin receptor [Flavobacterium hibernum]OXA83485.1 ferric aerobactin receptor [Flavobacterium hibernum]STO18692.1 Iron-regulated outer membrane proteins [Flavobacterium hibernum]